MAKWQQGAEEIWWIPQPRPISTVPDQCHPGTGWSSSANHIGKGPEREEREQKQGHLGFLFFSFQSVWFFFLLNSSTVLFLKLSFSYFSPNIASVWLVPMQESSEPWGCDSGNRVEWDSLGLQGHSPCTVLAVVRHEYKGHLSHVTLRWLTDLVFWF